MINKYIKKIIIPVILTITISGFAFPKIASAETNWLDPNWQYRKPIVIDNSKNALPLKNYLLTINLDNTNFDFYKANTSGYDFRFTQDNGKTLLEHNIEYYNYPKSARVKIKIPYAPAKLNSLIYFYYGAKTNVANISQTLSVPAENIAGALEIFDEGSYYGPSDWKIDANQIIQNSNIWSYDAPAMSGTYVLLKDSNFTAGDLDVEIMSKDDDGLGVIFGSKDKNNYYRLSWFKQAEKSNKKSPGSMLGSGIFLQKKLNAVWSTLYHSPDIYQQNQWSAVKITLDSENIKISINSKNYVNIKDSSIRGPKYGFYSWANVGSYFRNVSLLGGYENPDLYLPVSYKFNPEESFAGFIENINAFSPSTIIKISENENVYPGQTYPTKWPTPIFAGLVTAGLKVKLIVDSQIIADLSAKEGEKSGVSNWSYWHKNPLAPGEHEVYAIPYNPETGQELPASSKIKFLVQDPPSPKISPLSAPKILGLGENPKVDMRRIYLTKKTEPTITGLSPFGWPVRIYIDLKNYGNAKVQGGETNGTANFYFKPKLTKGRHTLVAVTYNPATGFEPPSPQVITFEVR